MDTSAPKPLALVTGASSGIGYELAKQFAENGFDLVLAAEDASLAQAAQDVRALGADVQSVQVDLATYDGVERLYAAATSTGRPIDAVALNAGVGVGGDFARQTDLRDELNLIDLNVRSTVHLAKRVAPDMVKRGGGGLLFTASVAATTPGPYEAVYAASKAFVLSFSDALHDELKDTGVTVTALLPGPTETEFFERAGMGDTKVGAGKKDDAAQVARQGFEGLIAGDRHVRGGSLKSKTQGALQEVLPEGMKAAAHRKMAEPGSAP